MLSDGTYFTYFEITFLFFEILVQVSLFYFILHVHGDTSFYSGKELHLQSNFMPEMQISFTSCFIFNFHSARKQNRIIENISVKFKKMYVTLHVHVLFP